MERRSSKPAIEAAAARLRTLALQASNGALMGSEDTLVQALGFSRSTVRQVARLLEQEGLLRVKRGIGGGYYAARPDARTIERTVSTYLETVDFDPEDVTAIASTLWIEVVRKAAAGDRDAAVEMAGRFRKRVAAVKPTSPFADIRVIERAAQEATLGLARSPYIRLIFDINIVFASRAFPSHDLASDSEEHRAFVEAWRQAKTFELAAIASGDVEVAGMAARHLRSIWHRRIWFPERDRAPRPDR